MTTIPSPTLGNSPCPTRRSVPVSAERVLPRCLRKCVVECAAAGSVSGTSAISSVTSRTNTTTIPLSILSEIRLEGQACHLARLILVLQALTPDNSVYGSPTTSTFSNFSSESVALHLNSFCVGLLLAQCCHIIGVLSSLPFAHDVLHRGSAPCTDSRSTMFVSSAKHCKSHTTSTEVMISTVFCATTSCPESVAHGCSAKHHVKNLCAIIPALCPHVGIFSRLPGEH